MSDFYILKRQDMTIGRILGYNIIIIIINPTMSRLGCYWELNIQIGGGGGKPHMEMSVLPAGSELHYSKAWIQ